MGRLWKVLIADDEPIIREGIMDAVDWQTLGMEQPIEAEDGEEALELARAILPDIMLVDLNMPIKGGMELIREVRGRLPDCKIIIITGHDEFQYAQEAIRLQVDDYILKPTRPVQLQQVLAAMGQQLAERERQRQEQQEQQLASRQMMKNIPVLRVRLCQEWLQGELSDREAHEQLRLLQLPASNPHMCAVIHWSELTSGTPGMRERDRQLLLYAMENIASEWLHGATYVLFRDTAGLIVCCVWEQVDDAVWLGMVRSVEEYLKLQVVFHTEFVGQHAQDVVTAYNNCKAAVYREGRISPTVRRARRYIREHYADSSLSLERIAAELRVNPVYLSRIIKQELGMAFSSLLAEYRIQCATRLLRTTDLAIFDIAERSGYDSQHYFSTAFKKATGTSPTQYRRTGSMGQELG